MKTILKSIIVIILFTTISCKTDDTQTETATQQKIIKQNYITETPKRVKYGNEITATGFLSYKNEYQLSFMVSGIINYLDVNEGDYVRKGQVLAKELTKHL